MSRDPFHDLHHKEPGATPHIRLISEGGSSFARTPMPVCIDSIQVAQTCTTESQHTVYHPATACTMVAPQDNSLFCIPLEHAVELDKELIPDVLRHRLEQLGSRLTSSAQVSVRDAGRLWRISDQGRTYSVRRLVVRLAVYTGPAVTF